MMTLKNFDMTQEEKQLLLKDLCARLPYIVKFDAGTVNPIHTLQTIYTDAETYVVEFMDEIGFSFELDDIKPYLRPMSSMTEEEEDEWWKFANKNTIVETHSYSVDWLNAHHFDYRGLIPKGLALEATEGMYVIK